MQMYLSRLRAMAILLISKPPNLTKKLSNKSLRISSRAISKKMTPLKKASNFFQTLSSGLRNEPYIKINVIFAGVILLVLAYSGIFSPDKNNYPVVCIHQKLTGRPCFSCGLSHSFSLIVRGRIEEAYKWNIYGMRVFIFFFSQFLMRIFFTVIYLNNENQRIWLIRYDIAGSILLFSISFYPFFRQLLLTLV